MTPFSPHNHAVLKTLPRSGDTPRRRIGIGMMMTVIDNRFVPYSGDTKPEEIMFIARVIAMQGRMVRVRRNDHPPMLVFPNKCFFNADDALAKWRELGGGE